MGGTASILLAIHTYKMYAKTQRGINNPEMIFPSSIHVAYMKSCDYFDIKYKILKIDEDTGLVSLDKYKKAINRNTIMIA